MATTYVRLKNHQEFNESLVKILAYSRKPVIEVMERQARGIVGKAISVTPPLGKKKGVQARKSGERTVGGNIRKVLQGVPVSSDRGNLQSISEGEIGRWHEKSRVAGRVEGRRRTGKDIKKVPSRKLNAYIKRRKQAVGMLAAGWNKAAAKFGVSSRDWPTFVRRHNPPGQADMKVTSSRIRIRFSNRVKFAGKVDVMPGRLNWALGRQTGANERIIASYKGAARRAGFRVV